MKRRKTSYHARLRRHLRVRKTIHGTAARPRLAVYRSLTHIYVQLIDDDAGHTLVAASDLEGATREQVSGKRKTERAKLVGETIGQRAQEQGISSVIFDRGGYKFGGRVKALATGAREAGLKF